MAAQRRPGFWLPSLYYYLAAAIGLVIALVGVIGGLRGLVTAALPQIASEVRYAGYPGTTGPTGAPLTPQERDQARADAIAAARVGGYADALYGTVAVIVGTPVFVWHLRQARRREPELLAQEAGPQSGVGD